MSVRQNLRFALSTLRRNPGFAVTAVGTLALGISVNSAIFSVVNAVLLQPLPYRDAGRLVLLWTTNPQKNAFERSTGYLNVQDWRNTQSFEAMAHFRNEPVVLREEPEPEPIDAAFVSPDFFTLLGIQPVLGRSFTNREAERGEPLVVLGYGIWQRRFAGSPNVIGRALHIEGRQVIVVGVMPADFRPLTQTTQLWMPYSSASFFDSIRSARDSKFGWDVLAKLRPGVRLEQAQAEMNGVAARLAAAWPDTNRGSGVRVVSLLDQVTSQVRLALKLLLAAVTLVLLIACVNVGNLLLARATGRAREVAVRASLGATRGQLISQFLTESVVLSLIAASLGFGLAAFGLRALLAFAPHSLPRLNEVSLNLRALLFTVTISLLSALLFGLTPALRLAGGAIAPGQRAVGGARSTRRLRDVLVVTEYALAIVLLAGAGLLVRSLASVLRVDPGFHAAGVLTVELHSPAGNDPSDPPRFQELVESLEALPGVEAAGGISRYFQANTMRDEIAIAGMPPLDSSRGAPVNYDVIAGHYLQALGIPLLRGRYFSVQDGPNATKVAIVNKAFAHAFLPDENPVGKVFRRGSDTTGYTIVGVIGDTRRQDLTREAIPEVFWPHSQRPWGMNLAIRASGDTRPLVNSVRNTIHRVDNTAVVKSITTLDRQMDDRVAQRRFQTWLLSGFAALALFLALIGIYGVMHYCVSERTQELGIRIALGAQPQDVFRLVLKHAGRLAVAGMAVGLLCALWATRLLASLLYGVSAHDPVTYVGVLILLAAVALAASASPARRATKCDPLLSLRQD
ncbi:MAG TPA: ABC transporter permease [Bryobacteraceae bacterium]|nr:ABC transporter permease [Bryobacteraceae bacterium]